MYYAVRRKTTGEFAPGFLYECDEKAPGEFNMNKNVMEMSFLSNFQWKPYGNEYELVPVTLVVTGKAVLNGTENQD